jgi:hypothetical protein
MYMCNHLNLSIIDNILAEFSVVSTIHLQHSYLLSLSYKTLKKTQYTLLEGGKCAYDLVIYMNINKPHKVLLLDMLDTVQASSFICLLGADI